VCCSEQRSRHQACYGDEGLVRSPDRSVFEELMSLSVLDMPGRRARLWLIVVGFVALSGSAMVVSVRVLLLAGAALVIPAVALTFYSKVSATFATPREQAPVGTALRARGSPDSSGGDVYGWENEGGAPATQ
jgi:hypothetical protein